MYGDLYFGTFFIQSLFENVASVCKDLSIQVFGWDFPYFWVSVVNICSCKTECYDFSSVVTQQMKFESVTPSHCTFSIGSHSFEICYMIQHWEITFHVFTNTIDVIMLEITISSEMEKEKNGHDLTIRQGGFPVTMFLSISDRKKIFLQFKLKILIKLINKTEIFRNFILGDHCY